MKTLPKPLKAIFSVLLILVTLIASISACLGVFAWHQGYYNTPERFLSHYVLQYQLDTDTYRLMENFLTLWDEQDNSLAMEYLEQFTAQEAVQIKITMGDAVLFDNLTDLAPLNQSFVYRNLYNPVRSFAFQADLTTVTPNSVYETAAAWSAFLYQMRYGFWIIAGVGTLLMIGLSILLIAFAGRKKDPDAPACGTVLSKMPFSIILVLMTAAGFGLFFLANVLDAAFSNMTNFDLFLYALPFVLGVCCLLFVWLCCLFVKKLRDGSLLTTLLCYHIGKFAFQKLFIPLGDRFCHLWKNLNLWWKGGLVLGGTTLLDLLLIWMLASSSRNRNSEVVIFAIGCLMLYHALLICAGIYVLINLQTLKAGALRIKEGGLEEKIDSSRMFWEFERHADTLNSIGDGMLHAVNDRMKSERFQTELITNVSHDIKTPMTSVINYIDLLQKLDLASDTETAKEYICVLSRQSARLKKLTEDLVEASKAQSGALTPVLETLDLQLMTEQALGEYTDRMEEAGFSLIIKKPEESVWVKADGKMLWRVLDNLLSNVLKYALPQTRVFIELEETGVLTVKNISKEVLSLSGEELTARFVRGDAARSGATGSGLGLSIASSLSALMGGKLTVTVDGDLFKACLSLPTQTPHSQNP